MTDLAYLNWSNVDSSSSCVWKFCFNHFIFHFSKILSSLSFHVSEFGKYFEILEKLRSNQQQALNIVSLILSSYSYTV